MCPSRSGGLYCVLRRLTRSSTSHVKLLTTSRVSVDRRHTHSTLSDTCVAGTWSPLCRLGRVPKPVQVGLPCLAVPIHVRILTCCVHRGCGPSRLRRSRLDVCLPWTLRLPPSHHHNLLHEQRGPPSSIKQVIPSSIFCT